MLRVNHCWLRSEVMRPGPFGLCHERIRDAALLRELPTVSAARYTRLSIATREVQQRISEVRGMKFIGSNAPGGTSDSFFEEVEAVG